MSLFYIRKLYPVVFLLASAGLIHQIYMVHKSNSNSIQETTGTVTRGCIGAVHSSSSSLSYHCKEKIIQKRLARKYYGKAGQKNATIEAPCGRKIYKDSHHHHHHHHHHDSKNKNNVTRIEQGNNNESSSFSSYCGKLELPVTTTSAPVECWPRVVLLPSYPTSGNELVHQLFHIITGLLSFHSHPNAPRRSPRGLTFDLSTEHHVGISLSYEEKYLNCIDSSIMKPRAMPYAGRVALTKTHFGFDLAMPYAGRVALTKTHFGFNDDNKEIAQRFRMTESQKRNEIGGKIAAVIRLARNPGDHLLRDSYRWGEKKARTCKDVGTIECFSEHASKYCDRLEDKADEWNRFHEFWDVFEQQQQQQHQQPSSDHPVEVPQMILHYEQFTSSKIAPGVFRQMISFVNETEMEPGTLEEKVPAFVKDPTYEQGTLVAKLCGVPLARKIHIITQRNSDRLGYKFDQETGFWSLSYPPQ